MGWQASGLEQVYEDPPHVVLLKRCPCGFADRRREPCTLPMLPDLTFPEFRRIEGVCRGSVRRVSGSRVSSSR